MGGVLPSGGLWGPLLAKLGVKSIAYTSRGPDDLGNDLG